MDEVRGHPVFFSIVRQIRFAFPDRLIDVLPMPDPCKMPSPENPRASKAGRSRDPGSAPLFKTITSDDWKRSLASARQQKNAISERIRTRTGTSSSSPKTK